MINFTPSQNKIAATAYTVASFAVVIAFVAVVGWLVLKFLTVASSAVVPVAAGFFLALFFRPYYQWLEMKLRNQAAAFGVLLLTVLVPPCVVVWCAGSMIADEFTGFIGQIPDMLGRLLGSLESSFPKAKGVLVQLGHSCEKLTDVFNGYGGVSAGNGPVSLNAGVETVAEVCASGTNAVLEATAGVLPSAADLAGGVSNCCVSTSETMSAAATCAAPDGAVATSNVTASVLDVSKVKIGELYSEYGESVKKTGTDILRAGYEKLSAAGAGVGAVAPEAAGAGHGFGWVLAGCGNAVMKVAAGLLGVVQTLVSVLVTMIFFAYFIMAKNCHGGQIVDTLPLLKDDTKKLVADQIDRLSDILVCFYQRQTVICLIEGFFYGVGFWLVGLPYGFFIGFLLGVLNLVPFLGSVVCLPLAVPFAYFGVEGSGLRLALVLVVWGLGQILDGYYITPMIQGNKTGLGYAGVIFSFVFWTIFLGPLLGMLLAIPLSACCLVLWRTFCDITKTQKLL